MKPLTEDQVRDWVRAHLKKSGLSMRALSQVTGADLSTLSRFLQGKPVEQKFTRALGFEARYIRT